jgi:hypothetical protein
MDLGLTPKFSIMSHSSLKFWRIKVCFWGILKGTSLRFGGKLGLKVFRISRFQGVLKFSKLGYEGLEVKLWFKGFRV